MPSRREIVLKLEAPKKWFVREIVGTNRISCTKKIAGKTITFYVVKTTSDLVYIEFPRYNYVAKTSYFTSEAVEDRWCRDMRVLFPVRTYLVECGLWENVSNKNFFVINSNNERLKDKEALEKIQKRLEQIEQWKKEEKNI